MSDLILVSPTQLQACNQTFRCASGRGGLSRDKVEGDGATPIGQFSLGILYYRPDRVQVNNCQLPIFAINETDGWCDDPDHPLYNQLISLPFLASHEKMWRQDHVYDIVIVVNYNISPIIPGKGSAIFIHLARENYEPTAGCIALNQEDLLFIIPQLTLGSQLIILP